MAGKGEIRFFIFRFGGSRRGEGSSNRSLDLR